MKFPGLFLVTPLLALAQAQSYVTFTFDPPGSTNTVVNGINNAGQIVGLYADGSGGFLNFIRSADGVTFRTIDVPGALPFTTTTDGINNLGQVVGTYRDVNGTHGYILSPDSRTVTTLETGLAPKAINDKGDIAGQIEPSGFVAQAFVRTADGRTTLIPGWSYANGINNNGDVVGWTHSGTNGVNHGYVRHADGSTETIDVPGTDGRTRLYSINNHGQIGGDVLDGHVFIRNADGTFATFDLLGVTQTSFVAIDDSGRAVADSFDAAANRYHGFLAVPSSTSIQPAIRKWSGVLSASGFGGAATIAPGSWIEIYGQNLAPTTREWRFADFAGSTAPTSLEGVTVRINGSPAYISYISPTQINALVPAGVALGPATVVVTNGGPSSAYTVTVNALTPGLYASPLLNIFARNLMAFFPDGGLVAPLRRAKAGDYITFYGIGFGPVSPDVPVGQIATQASRLQSDVEVRFNGVLAKLDYAGVAPGTVGLYQFNVIVPEGIAPGDSVSVTLRRNDFSLPPSPQAYLTSVGQ